MKAASLILVLLLVSPVFAEEANVYTEEDLNTYKKNSDKSSLERSLENLEKKLQKEADFFDEVNRYSPEPVTQREIDEYMPLIGEYFNENLKDPESFKTSKIRGNRRGPYYVFIINYRAKNSYGGYEKGEMMFFCRDKKIIRAIDPSLL